MLPSAATHVEETINQLFEFIQLQGNTDYIGERVSQLQHSLQCAYLATQSKLHAHDHEVILGALLHDVGRFIPASQNMPKMIAPDGTYVGRSSHEILGERYLRQLGFSDKVSQLVGAHVVAKRYLTATEPGYYEALSKTSKRTLQYQGGQFTDKQIEEAKKDPLLDAKLAVRKWDDLAKDPDMKVPGLEAYKAMAINSLAAARSTVIVKDVPYKLPTQRTAIICLPRLFEDPKKVEYPASLTTMSSFAQNGGLVVCPVDDRVESPKDASHFQDILTGMEKFGLQTSIAEVPKSLQSKETIESHLNSAFEPLLRGNHDISVVNLSESSVDAQFWQLMQLIDTKVQQLVQNKISVVIAEDYNNLTATAASMLFCEPTPPSCRTSSTTTSAGRLHVCEVVFN